MKKVLVAFCAAVSAVLFSSGGAYALNADGLYLAPKIGAVIEVPSDEEATYSLTNQGSFTATADYGNKTVFGFGLAAGYDFHPAHAVPVRAELEFLARTQMKLSKYWANGNVGIPEQQEFKASVYTVFANFYFDLHTKTNFTPYVGAGLGAAFINAKVTHSFIGIGSASDSKTNSEFAWNIGLGVAYSFSKNWALDLGYRYVGFGEPNVVITVPVAAGQEVSGDYRAKLSGHEFLLGLRYTF